PPKRADLRPPAFLDRVAALKSARATDLTPGPALPERPVSPPRLARSLRDTRIWVQGDIEMEDESDLTGATPRRRPKPDVLEIGGRRLKPSTLMMGHGFDPALSEGSLKPPIFLTSTFVFENAAAGKRHFEGVTGKRPGGAEGLIYSRFNGPDQE